jgi:hypothetical protein
MSSTDRVKNEEALYRVKGEWIILRAVERRKTDSISHISRRNCLVKYIIEGRVEGTGRRERRCKQLWINLR